MNVQLWRRTVVGFACALALTHYSAGSAANLMSSYAEVQTSKGTKFETPRMQHDTRSSAKDRERTRPLEMSDIPQGLRTSGTKVLAAHCVYHHCATPCSENRGSDRLCTQCSETCAAEHLASGWRLD